MPHSRTIELTKAETHHKSEQVATKARRYTVGYVSDSKYQPVPAVTLKGHGLAEAGFETGTPLDVRVMADCLILMACEPAAPPESEIMQTLSKVCKPSARKQRQVTELIEVISKPKTRAGN